MPNIPAVSNAPNRPEINAPRVESNEKRQAEPAVPAISEREKAQKQYNAAVLQANYDVSISTRNQPQALVYKAAIDAINNELEGELGPNAIEQGYDSGLDVSPEATANRIVTMTTSMFSLFQESNPELSFKEQVDRFLDIVKSGVDQGFGEAREILDGLGVLEGEIEENIDKTYDLVIEGFSKFKDNLLAPESTDTGVPVQTVDDSNVPDNKEVS